MATEPALSDRPLLEVEYVNYAWGKVYNGYFVNEAGAIYKYDRKGTAWPKSEDTTGALSDLNDKYAPELTLQSKHADNAASLPALIAAVDPKSQTPETGHCADAGIQSYFAYKYEGDRYSRVLLWRAGDRMQQNLSSAAQQLITYIRSLKLIDELQGCAP